MSRTKEELKEVNLITTKQPGPSKASSDCLLTHHFVLRRLKYQAPKMNNVVQVNL